MAKKTREELLDDARKRQAARKKALDKQKEFQARIPKKIPGVPAWATALARNPLATDIASLAFSRQPHEAALIAALEATSPSIESVGRDLARAPTPSEVAQAQDIVRSLVQIDWGTGGDKPRSKKRSKKQMMNDSIQADALKVVNKKARKKDGSFKKGWDQRKVMILAQKECTKERERLGLCKRKSTRKGQRRKTARRAYEK